MSIGVAIIGSGIFAREQHLPAVQEASDLELKAVYSRSLKSAQGLAGGLSGVELYSGDSGTGKSYADLLAREDIAAVILVLPIPAQPEYIKQALAAGKHVLSEKPIAKDLVTAQDLMSWYAANVDRSKIFWGVAENFRYTNKWLRTATEVQKLGGIKTFRLTARFKVPTDSKYYKTEWRKTPEHQGGFVLDGGVHMAAGLRLILGAGNALKTVSAQTCLQQEHLPPLDTVDAVLKTESGATGVLSLSYGSEFKDLCVEFTCAKGVVTLVDDRLTVNGESFDIPFEGVGVKEEVAAFGASIVKGALDKELHPEQALADLEVLEMSFQSGEGDGEKKREFSRSIFDPSDNSQRQPRDDDKMVLAKKHVPIVKKRTKRFFRHQSDRFKCVPESWRKPKGIDSRVRRRFKGNIPMPSIGYGSNKKTKHMMPSGHKAFLVHNPKDVELLLMHNRTYAAEIAHAVSSRKRVDIIAKAKALGVKVTNPRGRVTTEA
ncbi:hypothetical protein P175DRAFT_0528433 [Aspergillus ochraceoroseus IBT 24754]|uniref:Gfo/Idh/MocA-like oxidoreductase N-terminal domain-containing protein n=2 Tax=Aspergillus ochraceoroseus TaxID=138278 RepID=A0A2T5M8Q0_9EURO|nr:uncharacterized protein P175DRAFT_0528433 [Aspergillus ochraceoroseus IBT 24754]KKK19137.1 hypothetical protein AOCH_004356 [Aspergillus ochraceoroseus]PTU24916.1 hypothetical protein P175DRAFT_0528433 [Aspergillus ochraceoroseus IBT 24754]